ncbi:MAG: matrixin family metalloprotease [Lentisphaerae bacterium]|nr:matrixin family metalloprotease [Lentisphaerota bacterium]
MNRLNRLSVRRIAVVVTGLLLMASGSARALNLFVQVNSSTPSDYVTVVNNSNSNSYTVTSSTLITGLGTGTLLQIFASSPSLNSQFVDWSGYTFGVIGSSTAPNTSFTVGASDDQLFANFGLPQQALVMHSDGNQSGMTPAVNSTNYYNKGSDASIQTGPIAGYVFRVWGSDLNDDPHPAVAAPANASSMVRMDADQTVKAYFSRLYTLKMLNASGPSSGSLTYNLPAGSEYTATVPNAIVADTTTHRYRCNGWNGGSGDIPATGTATSYGPYTVSANSTNNWLWVSQYRLLIDVIGDGEVSPSPDTNHWYDAGTSVSMIATPTEGNAFLGWYTSDGQTLVANGDFVLTMNQGWDLQAKFGPSNGDSDNDQLPDWWEIRYGLVVSENAGEDNGGGGDPDNDGLSNSKEYGISNTNGVAPFDFADPLNADTDDDGMDDGYERGSIDPDDSVSDGVFISAVIDRDNEKGRGPFGNPDGDLKWTTSTGYESIHDDLANIDEWTGPDDIVPLTYETVAVGAIASDGWSNSLSKSVYRAIANVADTDDQTESNTTDTDEDGFDDGFEWSWDRWQRLNDTNVEVFVYGLLGEAITNEVPDWVAATNSSRRFHPNRSHTDIDGVAAGADGDVLYDYESGGVSDSWYSDIREYHASDDTAFSPGVAAAPHSIDRYQFPSYRRCSHPFYIDVDQDGLPDGYEVIYGLDPWSAVTPGEATADASRNPDEDYMAFVTNLIHKQVYDAHGFDPRTAWGASYPEWNSMPGTPLAVPNFPAPNTRPYGYLDEARGLDGKLQLVPLALGVTTGDDATSPVSEDSDGDGIWDGWELYVGLNPNGADSALDIDIGTRDGLSNGEEFDSFVTGVGGTGGGAPLAGWMNKIFPTDPNDPDTDGDLILDGTEQIEANAPATNYTFRLAMSDGSFTTETVNGGSWQIWAPPYDMGGCYVGGGMNPTSADTDHDGLPDSWEAAFHDTMNGALMDIWDDPDGDRLLNYMEYLTGATYHWQFDAWAGGAASYDLADFFYGTPKHWDWYQTCNHRTFNYIPFRSIPHVEPLPVDYATCDPGDSDSDGDGMDDYWESYHGLNPTYGFYDLVSSMIAGSMVAPATLVADPRVAPYVSGTPMMDPDGDGIVNVEESVGVSLLGPPTHHTDPTPYWMTDLSYDNSWVNLYYTPNDSVWYYAPPRTGPAEFPSPLYIYDFESNSGYDTDNDNIAEYDEIVDGTTDPVDDESPIRRHALYLPEAGGYARTRDNWFYFNADTTMLREFTVEAWANPLMPAKGTRQVIVERPFLLAQGNPDDLSARIRLNFRIGLDASGRPFAAYNGSGSQGVFVEALAGPNWALASNEWTHLAATYAFQTPGQPGRLRLYVNGQLAKTFISDELPVTGYSGVANQFINFAPLVIGAEDLNPGGFLYGNFSLPNPTSFFHGWIDEVRVWDGARSAAEIVGTMRRSLTRAQATSEMVTASSSLVARYGFDDLPDPQHEGVVPDGFAYTMSQIAPTNWTAINWWASAAPERSSVYTDYMYVPFISDTMEHFPVIPPLDIGDTNAVTTNAFGDPIVLFPNPANPYGDTHVTAHAFDFEGLTAVSDVLPCRGAEADADVTMWDDESLGTTPFDSDGDGMSDEWEEAHGLDPLNPSGDHGADGDPDEDGLSNLYEYLTGNDPNAVDSDGNGVSDGNEDFDGDGLSNAAELSAGTRPDQVDTDDDGVSDWEEVTGATDAVFDLTRPDTSEPPVGLTSPINPLSPGVARALCFDGNARAIIPPSNKLMSEDWTVEMWVRPDSGADGGVLISRYVRGTVPGTYGNNYVLGLSTNAPTGQMRPYLMYRTQAGDETILDGTGATDILTGDVDVPIAVDEWSHLAGTYDSVSHTLKLYVNAVLAASRTDATDLPATVYGYHSEHWADEVTLGASRSTGAIVDGFEGVLDEVRVWRGARTAVEIADRYNAPQASPFETLSAVIRLKSRVFVPQAGMSAALSALDPSATVHAIVQFTDEPTSQELGSLAAVGLKLVSYVSPTARLVSGTVGDLAAIEGAVRAIAGLGASDKISSRLETGMGTAQRLVVQFHADVPVAVAEAAVAAAEAVELSSGYLAGTYMLVEATGVQILALAASDATAWLLPAGTSVSLTGVKGCLHGLAQGGLEVAPFALVGDGWDGPGLGSKALTYYFKNTTADLSPSAAQSAVVAQMSKWAAVAAVSFSAGGNSGLGDSIDIDWAAGEAEGFDGPYGILAYAYFPDDINPEPIAGDMRFDEDEDWTIGASGIDLRFVALHELGHSLGLGHSDDPDAVMYPFYDGSNEDPYLRPDDIDGILALYGGAGTYGTTEFRFDDGGFTAQDFSVAEDWDNKWASAATLDGATFCTNTTPLLDKDYDGDRLPDWWEIVHGLDPTDPTGSEGTDGDPDGDGLSNLNEFLAGTDPMSVDSDGDGTPDSEEDSDNDGVQNGDEANVFTTNPGRMDTDDDGLNDAAEIADETSPIDSLSPLVYKALAFDGLTTGNVVRVSDRIFSETTERLSMDTWTIEVLIQPSNIVSGVRIPLVSRAVESNGRRNFDVGLTNGIPYVGFDRGVSEPYAMVLAGSAVTVGEWTHIAGRFGDGVLTLFVDGQSVGSRDVPDPCAQGVGDLLIGAPQYKGLLRDVRIWRIARSDAHIAEFKDRSLFYGVDAADAGYLQMQTGDAYLREFSTIIGSDGDYIDALPDEWTLESWVRVTGEGLVVGRKLGSGEGGGYNYYLGVNDNGTLLGRFTVNWDVYKNDTNGVPEYQRTEVSDTVNDLEGEINVTDGEWHHVAYVRDQESCWLYVDGIRDGKTARLWVIAPSGDGEYVVGAHVVTIEGPVRIGYASPTFTDPLIGSIDETRIWARALTHEERIDFSGRNLSGDESGLVTYFGFDFQSGEFAEERSHQRDPMTEFGVYLNGAYRETNVSDGPLIDLSPLRVLRRIKLAGLYSADDGGSTLEDFIYRFGRYPFDDDEYAGQLGVGVDFVLLSAMNNPMQNDADEDGLPDDWESANGLNPNQSWGDHGTWADPDLDGLNNIAEYQAGTDPWDADSDTDGHPDFFSWDPGTFRIYGEIFTDFDGMDDAWEVVQGLDPRQYDANLDKDGDGWRNVAEFMAGTDPDLDTETPVPTVSFVLRYNGVIVGDTVILAYSRVSMDGMPDARYSGVATNFPETLVYSSPAEGYLREGDNWFFAFIDLDGDGAWQEGEPAGNAIGQPIRVDWSEAGPIEIALTDGIEGYGRFSWVPVSEVPEYKVLINNATAGSALLSPPVFIKAPRTWFHEKDYQNASIFGLANATYEWFVYETINGVDALIGSGNFTKLYHATMSKPVAVWPVGAEWTYAKNELRWTMDDDVTVVRVQIARDLGFTSVILDRQDLAPAPFADGKIHYTLPIYAGDGQLTNGVFYWRVQTQNGLNLSAFSDPASLTVNLADFGSGPFSIAGDVAYFGKVITGNFVVQAFSSPGFGSVPEAQVTLPNTSSALGWPQNELPFTLPGLHSGSYYVRSFLDQDGDKKKDPWESSGFVQISAYSPELMSVPVSLDDKWLPVWLADTDNDHIADDWEYQYVGNLLTMGPGPVRGYTDQTPGGLNDFESYAATPMNANPLDPDAAGSDGIPFWIKVAFDMDIYTYYAFTVATVGTDGNGSAVVRWPAPAGSSVQMLSNGTAQTSNNGVTLSYRLQYSQDLLTWSDLTGNAPVSYSTANAEFEVTDASHTNRVGFYRVLMAATQ